MKEILRKDYHTKEICRFICTGVWTDGHNAYSKITKDEQGKDTIIDCDNGTYYQARYKGQLVMVHI